jgi:hypothetical protein
MEQVPAAEADDRLACLILTAADSTAVFCSRLNIVWLHILCHFQMPQELLRRRLLAALP